MDGVIMHLTRSQIRSIRSMSDTRSIRRKANMHFGQQQQKIEKYSDVILMSSSRFAIIFNKNSI